MQRIDPKQANDCLSPLCLQIGRWNQITRLGQQADSQPQEFKKFKSPDDALKLYIFAQHVAGWLPTGDWKIIQIDNSTSLKIDEETSIATVLGDVNSVLQSKSIHQSTFLAKFNSDLAANFITELRISNLIHLFLLLECHVEIVSSNCKAEQFISIQDGYVYLMQGKDGSIIEGPDGMKEFESDPTRSPKWIREFNAKNE